MAHFIPCYGGFLNLDYVVRIGQSLKRDDLPDQPPCYEWIAFMADDSRQKFSATVEDVATRLQLPTKDVILEAITDAMPDSDDVLASISKGVADAMPYESLILGALTEGVKEAMHDGLVTRRLSSYPRKVKG